MKLNKSDVDILRKFGEKEEDIKQIHKALKYLKCTDDNDKRVKKEDVYKMLGQETFLSGLDRACFHWTSYRNGIFFDCSDLFSEKTDIKEFSILINKLFKNDYWNSKDIAKEIATYIIKTERRNGWGNWLDSEVSKIIQRLTGLEQATSDKLALEIRGI